MKKKAIPSPEVPRPIALRPRVRRVKAPALVDEAVLLADLRTLIRAARQRIAAAASSAYVLLCWQVGCRLLNENLQAGRAAYGKQILATLSQELTAEFGAGFSYTALTRMARFAEWITDERILASLSQELGWSHFVELLPIKDPLARDFYAEMCRIEAVEQTRARAQFRLAAFERAVEGEGQAVIVVTVSRESPAGLSETDALHSLFRTIRYREGITNPRIVSTPSTQLGRTYYFDLLTTSRQLPPEAKLLRGMGDSKLSTLLRVFPLAEEKVATLSQELSRGQFVELSSAARQLPTSRKRHHW